MTLAKGILDEVIGHYGCPYNIHPDKGWNWESKIFAELCHLLEIQKMRISPGHPQCNCQVEHFNWTLASMIKSYLKGRQGEWDRNLGSIAGAYWVTPLENTRKAQNLLMLGRENWLPIDVILSPGGTSTGEPMTSHGKYVDGQRDHMKKAHDIARLYLGNMLWEWRSFMMLSEAWPTTSQVI